MSGIQISKLHPSNILKKNFLIFRMSFHSSSRITSMIYDSFQSNIIIGGCYSGQICIWDIRANKKNPVCRVNTDI